jgi:hypothetical protein
MLDENAGAMVVDETLSVKITFYAVTLKAKTCDFSPFF